MITAIDTTVLLDVLAADPTFGEASKASLRNCHAEGRLVACDIVWAEISGSYPTSDQAAKALAGLGLQFDPIEADTALLAGRVWREYRKRGGRRERMVPDFLIGAHALSQADRLLSRDRGFYRRYFRRLTLLQPAPSAE